MRITVVGTGYVGLVTAVCLADSGNQVLCIDNNQEKLTKLRTGQVPIYEPGLGDLFEKSFADHRISFSDSLAQGVEFADVIFLALPTPPMEDGSADLSYILGVAHEIGKLITSYKVIVNKSTVPVGTAKKVTETIRHNMVKVVEFDVVSNPEFLREGTAVVDFIRPNRIVIGSSSDKARDIMVTLYQPFVKSPEQIVLMDEASSELTKYTANTFLAMKISFINEIANLCEKVGANVDSVCNGIRLDPRIGDKFISPGIGYGGSCFPKDVSALNILAAQCEYDFLMTKSIIEANNRQKKIMVQKVKNKFGSDLTGLTFAIWGLAFKPDTDDIREAPSLVIIDELTKLGAKVVGYDPEANWQIEKFTDLQVKLVEEKYEAVTNADALLIITDWREFKDIDLERLHKEMKQMYIFDGRNMLNKQQIEDAGFYYAGIGR
jgi:UDPglucose 6-dehydrogenase